MNFRAREMLAEIEALLHTRKKVIIASRVTEDQGLLEPTSSLRISRLLTWSCRVVFLRAHFSLSTFTSAINCSSCLAASRSWSANLVFCAVSSATKAAWSRSVRRARSFCSSNWLLRASTSAWSSEARASLSSMASSSRRRSKCLSCSKLCMSTKNNMFHHSAIRIYMYMSFIAARKMDNFFCKTIAKHYKDSYRWLSLSRSRRLTSRSRADVIHGEHAERKRKETRRAVSQCT